MEAYKSAAVSKLIITEANKELNKKYNCLIYWSDDPSFKRSGERMKGNNYNVVTHKKYYSFSYNNKTETIIATVYLTDKDINKLYSNKELIL